MSENKATPEIARYLKERIGETGLCFFEGVRKRHGKLDAVWMEGTLPHPVHFREGMSIRNILRESSLCDEWDCHDFDNNWMAVVEMALDL